MRKISDFKGFTLNENSRKVMGGAMKPIKLMTLTRRTKT